MTDAAPPDLRRFRDQPFELLRELERRTRAAVTGASGEEAGGEEWVGIGIRLGPERFVVSRDEVREVLMVPPSITRVPGARSWVRGLANVRGHLLPISDLREFLGTNPGNAGPTDRSARILVLSSAELPVGLVVDEVYGFRRFFDHEHAAESAPTGVRCDRYLRGAFRRGLEVWPVFDMTKLLESREFQTAAED
jgi:twitching motility protein PilI